MTFENLFISGGAYTGKTSRASSVASQQAHVTWVGTAAISIPEIAKTISDLKLSRPKHWQHLDCPLGLPNFLKSHCETKSSNLLVIDSISQWLGNELAVNSVKFDEQQLMQWALSEVEELVATLTHIQSLRPLIIVSSDFSHSLPPLEPQLRILRKANGICNQKLAALCQRFEWMNCGKVFHIAN